MITNNTREYHSESEGAGYPISFVQFRLFDFVHENEYSSFWNILVS